MGKLYDYCQRIQDHVERNGLDVFRTRGALALQTGFIITLVEPNDPDDPDKIRAFGPQRPTFLAFSSTSRRFQATGPSQGRMPCHAANPHRSAVSVRRTARLR